MTTSIRTRRLDPIVVIAVACVLAGWFWMNICVTTAGRIELRFHFYDMWELISRPALLFNGLLDDRSAKQIVFGIVCILAALAPLSVYVRTSRNAWLASFAPLLLMVLCGALLYYKTSPDYFATDPHAGELGREFMKFANQVAGKVVGGLAKHITLGLGAYVSLLASIVIAVRGWMAR
jgi:hypothetical protein